MLNMKYCRTENVIDALREWEDDPGTDEHLHHELYELCSRIAADAGLVPDMTATRIRPQIAIYPIKCESKERHER